MEAMAGRPLPDPRSRSAYHSLTVRPGSFYHALLILIILLCLSPVSALGQPGPIGRDTLDWRSGDIIAQDLRNANGSPPAPGLLAYDDDLHRADDADRTDTVDDDASQALHRRASTSSPVSMPRPFDTLASNFANASCMNFFSDFLSNSTVTDCHAVSMLLENSAGFFHTLHSAAATSAVLDVSCSASVTHCASIMTSLAAQLLQDDNCGADYQSNNTVVQNAYTDMLAYDPIYRATCLTNPQTQEYCFVDALNNVCAPDDYNVYFLPLGITLGPHTAPTCNKCLQATMDVFAHWASVNNQPLDGSYLPSARAVNRHCGANFASTNIVLGTNTVVAAAALAVPLPDLRSVWLLAVVLGATFAIYI